MTAEERSESAGTAGIGGAWERGEREARTIGETIAGITSGLRVLSEREMELARAEMLDTQDAAKSAGIWGAVGAIFGLVALEFLAVAGMLALMEVLVGWAAALVTAGVLLLIAVAAGFVAWRATKDFSLVPRHTMQSVREDIRWARELVRRNNA